MRPRRCNRRTYNAPPPPFRPLSFRLSASELRMLITYVLQMRLKKSGGILNGMKEMLILMEDMTLESVSVAPFVELDMSKIVSLGERSWPPAAGCSFVCWFQVQNLLKSQVKETESSTAGTSKRQASGQNHEHHILRIFSVGAANNENTFYTELYLQEDGVLTLATSNSCSLSFSGLELEEGIWHRLAVVHSKPNALAGLYQASVACVYLDGKLRHTWNLGYSPSLFGIPLQLTVGTPVTCARVSELTRKVLSCYLFEEVLTSGCIRFMYILGRRYRGLFQDTYLLLFVPNQACGGASMAIIDSNSQKLDTTNKKGDTKAEGSVIVWDMERLANLTLQLSGRKLIFAFDDTCTEVIQASVALYMLNVVDPMSELASPIWGIPLFGCLHGDMYLCRQCVIGDTICPVGGMTVVLALVEAAETRGMLHMAFTLLACALHQNPQNVRDLQRCQGYHLLSLFLRPRMPLFDMQSLEIFFQIAACEVSFSEPRKLKYTQTNLSPASTVQETSFKELNLSRFHDDFSSVGSCGDMDDFSAQNGSFSHISELENADIPTETSNCIVLSKADMVEHVLLDWKLWVTASVHIQIALLGFVEHLVSMHQYRNHNLAILRRINLVQHLLVTLQRGDVEVPVLEKLVVLLGVILEDGLLSSELEHVVRFVIMTFDPPELTPRHPILREVMWTHVMIRNMLLEMLFDLQVTTKSEELREQWHKIVSSKLISYFLDEAVHPTSMRWIMTLLGVCLIYSPTFALKFRSSGGYQGLSRVLTSFYDFADTYYSVFCLIFGKPVYPRLPEVRMLDFHVLMPNDGSSVALNFVELLKSVITMKKHTFDRLSLQSMLAYQTGNLSQVAGVVTELVNGNADMAGELQGEALMHKTYAARLMGEESSVPAAATSVLRFMVDLAQMCPPSTAICKRAEFLESCGDLYFSCVRAAPAVKMTKELSSETEEKNSKDFEDTCSSQNTFSSLAHEQYQSSKTFISAGSFPPALKMNPIQFEKVRHGTINCLICLPIGIVIAVDSRAVETHSLPGTNNKIKRIADDEAIKVKELIKGVYVTACGNGRRNMELWKHLTKLVTRGLCNDLCSLRDQAHLYLKQHSLPSNVMGAVLFMAGWHPQLQEYTVYQIGDGYRCPYKLNGLYDAIGSGSKFALRVLERQNIRSDMTVEEAAECARLAVLGAATGDPSSGGLLRVIFATQTGFRSICEIHTMDMIKDSPASSFPRNELYVIIERWQGFDLSPQLCSTLLGFDNDVRVQCLGTVGPKWFLYHVTFSSKENCWKMFISCTTDCHLLPVRKKQFVLQPNFRVVGYVGYSSRALLQRARVMKTIYCLKSKPPID